MCKEEINGTILTQDMIEAFLKTLQSKNKAIKDINEYRRNITGLQQIAAQHENLFNKEVMAEWKQSQKKQGISSGTMTNRVVRVNQFLRYIGCEDLCYQKGNPYDLTGREFGDLIVIEKSSVEHKEGD